MDKPSTGDVAIPGGRPADGKDIATYSRGRDHGPALGKAGGDAVHANCKTEASVTRSERMEDGRAPQGRSKEDGPGELPKALMRRRVGEL